MKSNKSSDQASQKMGTRVEGLMSRGTSLADFIGKSSGHRERKQLLQEKIRLRAMDVKRDESVKAAEICRLQDEYDRQDAHDLMILDHQQQMEEIEQSATRKAFASMQSILESRVQCQKKAENLVGDPDLIARALANIDNVHYEATQSMIDRNHDIVAGDADE
ncbi:MAG: hypothetical protein AB8B91_22190 [Rubripirellula sp.]